MNLNRDLPHGILFAVGRQALFGATTATNCGAIGEDALRNFRQGHFCIAIGRHANADGNGAHHLIVLGDHVSVPLDTPNCMLYIKGEAPRRVTYIDRDLADRIKAEARRVLNSEEALGIDPILVPEYYCSDEFWDTYIARWNASIQ